jgi:DNA processing protein
MEIEVLLWRDAAYPLQLRELADPPPILFARGRTELLRTRSQLVTIVGSRHCTGYGRRTAERLADRLAGRGITVVSGLALGIDGAAHRGALAANGDTIAVLGSGVDLIQPASHRRLGERIVREGLLMSEFLPEEPARAHHFPRRNRILAALSGATVVVEAAHKSGALITVEHALDVGRDVYVVPGPLDAPQSRGCNALIQQGAHLITSPDDFVRDLGLVCGSSQAFRDDPRNDRRPAGLDDEAGRVWHVLDERPAAIDDLACRAALDTSGALAALTSLELGGWVIQEPGMRFRRAS